MATTGLLTDLITERGKKQFPDWIGDEYTSLKLQCKQIEFKRGAEAERAQLEARRLKAACQRGAVLDQLYVELYAHPPTKPHLTAWVEDRATGKRFPIAPEVFNSHDGREVYLNSGRIKDYDPSKYGFSWSPTAALLSGPIDVAPTDDNPETQVTRSIGPIYNTGLPGKPSSWHLIAIECRRRYACGEDHPTTAEWSRALLDWLTVNHPNAPPMTPKTVKNRLAGLLRELRQTNGNLDRFPSAISGAR